MYLKALHNLRFLNQGLPAKTLLIMKLTLILTLVACFQVSAGGFAQKITLSKKDVPLETIFKEIKKQTGFNFIYNYDWLQQTTRVTIDVKDVPLEQALEICFKDQPLTYMIVDKTIALKKKMVLQPSYIDTAPGDIEGKVTDENGEPLSGATVKLKNGKVIAMTDEKGKFKIKDIHSDAIVEVSYTGYTVRELQVSIKSLQTISLKRSGNSLDEVQVIAYGTTTKRLNTGNVGTVKAADLEKQPVSNPLLALEGNVSGMLISQGTGLPGSAVSVQIRGQNSISNGNYPLYIIDGVPYISANYLPSLSTILGSSNTTNGGSFNAGSPFSYINPGDIESIDVLKDADATAIYGTRGANGVVLITTKKGKTGHTKIDLNVQSGFGKVADKMKLLNTRQYLDMRHEAFRNDGVVPDPNADYDFSLWDTTRNTDWQNELIGGTAKYTDLQGAVSGGNAQTQFLVGTSYHKETTVFPGDFNDQKGSVHFNINNVSPNQKFNILLSAIYTVDNNRLSGYDLTQQALQLAPDAPAMYNADGSINWAVNPAGVSTWPNYNPAAMLLLQYKTRTDNLVSNAVVSYQLLKGLDIKSSFGYANTQTNEVQTIPLSFNAPSLRSYVQRRASFSNNNTRSWIIEPQISFKRNISAGILSAVIGTTIQQNTSNGQILNASGFNSDLVLEDIKSATSITVPSTVNNIYKYNAGFGRLNYNWRDKYLVNLTGRRDGSSRFGPANQFHNFGAVGAAWIFSKEEFIQRRLSFLSFGKLRGSFGTTGSDQVGDYTFMDLYTPISVGVPYQGATGTSPNKIFTPDLSWEETRKMEAGAELGFLQDRILFTTSFYRNRSSNQLVGYLLPALAGFTTVEKNLSAVVQNEGWEFELNTVNIKSKNFRWTSSVNITLNRNVLLSGAAGLDPYYQAKIGHPLTSKLVYHFLGIDPFTGLSQVADSHGNPTNTPNPSTDANVLIDINPRFYGGFQNSISYKGLQLDFLFQFRRQPRAFNYLFISSIPGSFNNSFGGNQSVDVLNRWQEPGDVKPFQRFSQNLSTYSTWNNAQQSDQVYSDASYIRLRNLSLSWQLPVQWQRNLHVQNARLYMHGQNLLTITHYKGLDPETGSSTLPPLKVFTGGIQVTL